MARQRFVEESLPSAAPAASDVLSLLRPRQWVKNGLVLAAPLFSGQLFNPSAISPVLWTLGGFCLTSSAVYCLNDVLDVAEDRQHPRKRFRPVARGTITPRQAIGLAAALGLAGVAAGVVVNPAVGMILAAYMMINVLYSYALKDAVVLDIMTVAAGFVLRAISGGVAIGVELSLWFLVVVPLLSLLLAVGKRRHELLTLDGATGHRMVLDHYPIQFLDQLIAVLSGAVIMAYLLYAKDSTKPHLFMLTSPLVVYGMFRYLYLVYHEVDRGSPEDLMLSDVPLLVAVALWALATAAVIYLA